MLLYFDDEKLFVQQQSKLKCESISSEITLVYVCE